MSRLSFLIATLVALCGVPSWAEQSVLADLGPAGAEVFDNGGDVRVTVALSQPVPWRVRFADGPPRLIVEFKELVWSREPDSTFNFDCKRFGRQVWPRNVPDGGDLARTAGDCRRGNDND